MMKLENILESIRLCDIVIVTGTYLGPYRVLAVKRDGHLITTDEYDDIVSDGRRYLSVDPDYPRTIITDDLLECVVDDEFTHYIHKGKACVMILVYAHNK